ncbi:hypothetical protein LV83_03645 [Algoriphagus yeomjeoni]|uniref:Uncharacterized protein n=1 Tax=Algoriphagus yeomjeoni TaxID=291403 RepID=A0A327NZN5_9BACT|nr:hypothetical protein LV83_03645 [Algoriphagus yeomjeoni]
MGLLVGGWRLSGMGCRVWVVGYRFSVGGCRLSVVGYGLSVIGFQLADVGWIVFLLPTDPLFTQLCLLIAVY